MFLNLLNFCRHAGATYPRVAFSRSQVLLLVVLLCGIFGYSQAALGSTTVNLMSYGAVGDGVTDDGPALQQALDALASAGGGTLIIPSGKYAIASPVSKDFGGGLSKL